MQTFLMVEECTLSDVQTG